MAEKSDFVRSAPYWLRRTGVVSWLFLGIVLAAAVAFTTFATLSSIVIPLLVAAVVGVLFQPLVDRLEKLRVPRNLGTALTMAIIILGVIGLVVTVGWGFVDQGPQIYRELEAGWMDIQEWLLQIDFTSARSVDIRRTLEDALPVLGQGVAGYVGSTFSGATSFVVGLFVSIFILFFMLRDGPQISAWLGRHLAPDPETGAAIVADAYRSVRLYFRGTAITAAVTSFVVAIPLIFLNVPLVVPILVLYFFTSFIPYIGAFIAGAFAVLIALGSGGVETALIILAAVLISNGALQSVVSSWAIGSSLELHPLVVFLVTMAAGAVGGVLAMILVVPLTSLAFQAVARLRAAGVFSEEQKEGSMQDK